MTSERDPRPRPKAAALARMTGPAGPCRPQAETPEFVLQVLGRLRDTGHEAYVVGGAVRDMLLGRPLHDWDVATSASPVRIRSLFEDVRQFALRHETVTLVGGDFHCQVTCFKGPKGIGRRIEEDLGHRDFTVNALAYDPREDVLLDPHGGLEDLRRRSVRAVGSPGDRIGEDPLRLLRAVRIATELDFRIEPGTWQTLCSMAPALGSVAVERVRGEFMKILLSSRPSRGFNQLVRTGLLRCFLPELLAGYRKRQGARCRHALFRHALETVEGVAAEPIVRLAALLHDIAKPRLRARPQGESQFPDHAEESARSAAEILKRLRFSNRCIQGVRNLIAHHGLEYESGWTDGEVRRLIRSVGIGSMDSLLALCRADLAACGGADREREALSELAERAREIGRESPVFGRRDLAVSGRRVMEMTGLGPGRRLGEILDALTEAAMDEPRLNTEEGLGRLLGKIVGLRAE